MLSKIFFRGALPKPVVFRTSVAVEQYQNGIRFCPVGVVVVWEIDPKGGVVIIIRVFPQR